MNPEPNPSSREFFERMYLRSPDPWNFAGDTYELARYDAIISVLAGPRYARAFEPGCSVGVLTARLAPQCDELLAVDLSAAAIEQARERCAAHPHLRLEQGSVADTDPGPLDLLVLSEIGYYFTEANLRAWAGRLLLQLQPGGTLLAAHWLGSSPDHILCGDRVHEILKELALERSFSLTLAQRNDRFRIDLWKR